MKGRIQRLIRGLSLGQGVRDQHPVSHAERLVSILRGFVGIAGVIFVSGHLLDPQGSELMVASMGASAVLLFAVPHGSLSQPWNLVGGHLIAAAIGVACARFLPDPHLAATLAVALAIGAMHYLHCLHPPGGATALTAVAGGPAVEALGWDLVVEPVLLNVLTLLAIAVLFNLPLAWRRYPLVWRLSPPTAVPEPSAPLTITHASATTSAPPRSASSSR